MFSRRGLTLSCAVRCSVRYSVACLMPSDVVSDASARSVCPRGERKLMYVISHSANFTRLSSTQVLSGERSNTFSRLQPLSKDKLRL